MAYKYLVAKMGFDPNNSVEYEQAMSLYIIDLDGLITANAHRTYKYICQMHMSMDKDELDQCITDNSSSNHLQALFLIN